jgi:hypothetical protein
VFQPLPFGCEELDGIHARPGLPVQAGRSWCGGDRTVSIDGHVPLLVIGARCGITATGRRGVRDGSGRAWTVRAIVTDGAACG